ncbi:MAG: hypothetical protein ACRBI6_12220 [Acidimicrobiales bacterium]
MDPFERFSPDDAAADRLRATRASKRAVTASRRSRLVGRVATVVTALAVAGAAAVAAGIAVGAPPVTLSGLSPEAGADRVPIAAALVERADTVAYGTADIEALASPIVDDFPYPWETHLPEWTIEFVAGEDRIAGYTWSREHRIEVFVRSDSTAERLERVLAHEIGHAIDVSLNDTGERERWQEARGIENEPWWPDSGAADFETGAGDFAESFAYLLIGDADDFKARLTAPPGEAELALLEELIEP